MDTQTHITINYVVIIVAIIVLILLLRSIYKTGKRVNNREPQVRERYSSMVLKQTTFDKKLIEFLQTTTGKITVLGIIMFIIILLLYSFGLLSRIKADHIMVFLTFIAILITTYTFKENQKFITKQQFESTFFNMMKQLEDIISKIMIDDSVGRDAFSKFFNNTEIIVDKWNFVEIINDECFNEETKRYSNNTDRFGIIFKKMTVSKERSFTIKNLKYLIDNFGINGFESCKKIELLQHYFRYLTTIIQFIDDAEYLDKKPKYFDERYKYVSILRATLSAYEMVFLFYYGLTFLGQDFKLLAERYSLFMYLNILLLAKSKRDKKMKLFENGAIEDGERYKCDRKGVKDTYYSTIFCKDPDLFKSK